MAHDTYPVTQRGELVADEYPDLGRYVVEGTIILGEE